MKNTKNIIIGIILVIIGIILAGNALDLFDINLFFDGWWTLFIIVPCLVGIINDDDKKGNLIGFIIGLLLLLACQHIINFEIIWKLFVPIIIIIFGLSLIFKNSVNKELNKKIKELDNKSKENYTSTFSSQRINIDDEFKGTTINAIFGGVTLDLREAKIKDDILIETSSIFGGIDIYVPKDVKVIVKSNSIFGGVTNKKESNGKNTHTIYINASCLFGGVDIK